MNTAGWSQESTFAKFYHVPSVNQENGDILLQNSKHTCSNLGYKYLRCCWLLLIQHVNNYTGHNLV